MSNVTLDRRPPVLVVTIDRPGGTFCAGADLKALASGDPVASNRLAPEGDGPMGPTRMVLDKPVLAAIEGHAVAGGLELALWCDLRVAASDAVLGVFSRRFGVPLIDGGTVRLARTIGGGRALDLVLTGRALAASMRSARARPGPGRRASPGVRDATGPSTRVPRGRPPRGRPRPVARPGRLRCTARLLPGHRHKGPLSGPRRKRHRCCRFEHGDVPSDIGAAPVDALFQHGHVPRNMKDVAPGMGHRGHPCAREPGGRGNQASAREDPDRKPEAGSLSRKTAGK